MELELVWESGKPTYSPHPWYCLWDNPKEPWGSARNMYTATTQNIKDTNALRKQNYKLLAKYLLPKVASESL